MLNLKKFSHIVQMIKGLLLQMIVILKKLIEKGKYELITMPVSGIARTPDFQFFISAFSN